jgi:hypothetical protein
MIPLGNSPPRIEDRTLEVGYCNTKKKHQQKNNNTGARSKESADVCARVVRTMKRPDRLWKEMNIQHGCAMPDRPGIIGRL